MAGKKRVRYTTKMGKFICSEIENGLTLAEVCRTHAREGFPKRRTILNWQKEHPEFKEGMDFAYYCWVQTKIDRLNEISTTTLVKLYPELEHKEAVEQRRAEMDALKFITGKLAPALSTRWDKAQTVKHEGLPENMGPVINIMSYATELPAKIEKQVNNLIEQKDDKG